MDLSEGTYSFSLPSQVLSLALIFLTHNEREKRKEVSYGCPCHAFGYRTWKGRGEKELQ